MSSPEDLAEYRRAIREASESELWERLRGLVAAEPPPRGKLDFELVLLALKDRAALSQTQVRSTLSLVTGRSKWAWGGFLLASLAIDDASAEWARSAFAESPVNLREAVLLLMAKNRPGLKLGARSSTQ